jgi:hypothetical protein
MAITWCSPLVVTYGQVTLSNLGKQDRTAPSCMSVHLGSAALVGGGCLNKQPKSQKFS